MTTARTNGPKWLEATRPYRLAWAKAAMPCALCHKPIDYSLNRSHRDSLTVDHVVPLIHDGPMLEPSNWQPAHRSCNCSKGATDRNNRDAAANKPTRWRW